LGTCSVAATRQEPARGVDHRLLTCGKGAQPAARSKVPNHGALSAQYEASCAPLGDLSLTVMSAGQRGHHRQGWEKAELLRYFRPAAWRKLTDWQLGGERVRGSSGHRDHPGNSASRRPGGLRPRITICDHQPRILDQSNVTLISDSTGHHVALCHKQ